MKAMSIKNNKALTLKSHVLCADNSGAKEVYIISVFTYKTRKKGNPKAGIGSLVNVVVKKGKPEMRGKIERAVVIRTKQEYRRPSGMRVKFDDNAVVLVDEEGLPKASEIKGCVAREVGERFPKIAGLAPTVV
ncbi:MAG: 50S ribosomal protein L14 [Candidatus Diapherotrites archaeon]|jgi:large subunit ribosomal protein L14|nr:50S ribosomal protein L14 [Candidatus Diapherotrites archaeon]